MLRIWRHTCTGLTGEGWSTHSSQRLRHTANSTACVTASRVLQGFLTSPHREPVPGHVFKPGDTRWSMAPFLVHRLLKGYGYEWLLLGDDDTVWLLAGVQMLLSSFDWRLPYAISDHFGDNNNRGYFLPSPYAAACLPCHAQVSGNRLPAGSSPVVPSVGCPCTPGLACQLRRLVCAARGDCGPRKNFTGSSTQVCRFSWAHGGAGMVMSRALFLQLLAAKPLRDDMLTHGNNLEVRSASKGAQSRPFSGMDRMGWQSIKDTTHPAAQNTSLNRGLSMAERRATAAQDLGNMPTAFSDMEDCVRIKTVSSCDMMLARCLFEEGFGLTMTEYSWKLTGQHNNASYQVFDNHDHHVFLTNPMAAVVPNKEEGSQPHLCSPNNETYCVWLLEHAVSVHLRARSYTSVTAAAAAVVTLLRSYASARALAGLT